MKLTHREKLSLMRNMLLGRKLDEVMIEIFRKSPAGMWHSGIDHEVVGAGVVLSYARKKSWRSPIEA